jgi:lipoprotein-releasing system permease protein
MGFSTHIARRYLRSRRHSRFLSRSSVTSIAGIAIGVFVMNVALAVMNGFSTQMHTTFVENLPMISILTSDPMGFDNLGQSMDVIGDDPDVLGVAPLIRQEVLITAGRNFGNPRHQAGVTWGIDPDLVDTVQPLSKNLEPEPAILAALYSKDVPRIILGGDLANSLYADIGDTVVVTAPDASIDLSQLKSESRKFVVIGYVATGMADFDARFSYIHLDVARDFFGYGPKGASLISIKVKDPMRANFVGERLEDSLGPGFHSRDWMSLNANLFQWMKMEKIIMIILLGMIILIAGFNIVGILTMMVGERGREIGILISMGARRSQIMGIFLLNGFWLGVVGTAFGCVAGLAGIYFLDTYGIALPGDVYFVDRVPVLLQWGDFFLVAAISLVVSIMAGLWPSWEASNLKPVDLIRYS